MDRDLALDLLESDFARHPRPDTLNAWLAARRIRSVLGHASVAPTSELLRAVRELLAAVALDREPPAGAIDLVNAAAAAAPTSPQLTWAPGARPSAWQKTDGTPEQSVHGLIARSAIELATLRGRTHLRMCAAERCGRIFVSANPRRRWCSSDICGNRERVRRYTERQRARGSGTGRPGSAPAAGAGLP